MECATSILKLESILEHVPPSTVEKCSTFRNATAILGQYQQLTRSSKPLLPLYWRRLQSINPFKQVVSNWNESVTISPTCIKVRKSVADVVDCFTKLEKMIFFEERVLTAVTNMLQLNRPLSFANLTLSVSDPPESSPFQNINAIGMFLLHIHKLGFKIDTNGWIEKLEEELIEKYFNPQVPQVESDAAEIKNALNRILCSGKQLNVEFVRIAEFNTKLPMLIRHASMAKLIEKARQIIINSNLVGTIIPAQEPLFESENKTSEIMIMSNSTAPVMTMFQNYDRPISRRCAEIWKIIIVRHLITDNFVFQIMNFRRTNLLLEC